MLVPHADDEIGLLESEHAVVKDRIDRPNIEVEPKCRRRSSKARGMARQARGIAGYDARRFRTLCIVRLERGPAHAAPPQFMGTVDAGGSNGAKVGQFGFQKVKRGMLAEWNRNHGF